MSTKAIIISGCILIGGAIALTHKQPGSPFYRGPESNGIVGKSLPRIFGMRLSPAGLEAIITDAYRQRAADRFREGKADEAVAVTQELIAYAPWNRFENLALGDYALAAGQKEVAYAAYKKALFDDDNMPIGNMGMEKWIAFAELGGELHGAEEATRLYKLACETGTKGLGSGPKVQLENASLARLRSIAHLQVGFTTYDRGSVVLKWYEKAVALDPTYTDAKWYKAYGLYMAGRSKEAGQLLLTIRNAYDNDPAMSGLMALRLYQWANVKPSESDHQKIMGHARSVFGRF